MFIKTIFFRTIALVVVCCLFYTVSINIWPNRRSQLQRRAGETEAIPKDRQPSENRNSILGSPEKSELIDNSTDGLLNSKQLKQQSGDIVNNELKSRELQIKMQGEGVRFDIQVPHGELRKAATEPFKTSVAAVAGKRKYPANFTAIVIATYMRSGSSLTGDILQQHPDAFYVYEPLRNLQKRQEAKSDLTYQNGHVVAYPFDFLAVGTQLIEGWLTCNFDLIYMEAFKDSFLGYGIKTKTIHKCLKSDSVRHCIEKLQQLCLRSRVRIVKTIRLPMPFLGDFFEMIPDFKILHLVRDPRATLFSQKKRQKCSWIFGGLRGCSNTHCTRVEYDITFEKIVRARFPSRIHTVHYEQIAGKPINTAKSLYDFVGMEFLDSISKYVFSITSAGKKDTCVICTTRSNSTEHIDAWKSSIDVNFLNAIQYRCGFVMRTYNYQIVS